MKICLIHGRQRAREVIARALGSVSGAQVADYACCEDVLASASDHDVFIVYNNFGKRKMSGLRGTAAIRARNPDAYIIGVSSVPYGDKRFLKAGANAFLLKAGNEIKELVSFVRGQVEKRKVASLGPGVLHENVA